MNAPPVSKIVSTRTPSAEDYLDWLKQTCHPVLRQTEELTNKLSQNGVERFAEDGGISPDTDLVLANASGGSMILVLPGAAVWEKRIVVVKTDSSGNTVTVNGAVSAISLSTQYETSEVVCDGTNYYPVNSTAAAAMEPEIRVNLSSDQTLWSPAGWSSARRVYVNCTTACNVLGMDHNVTQRLKSITHVGTAETPLGFWSENPSVVDPADRIRVPYPNDLYMLLNREQDFFYDTTDARWRPV